MMYSCAHTINLKKMFIDASLITAIEYPPSTSKLYKEVKQNKLRHKDKTALKTQTAKTDEDNTFGAVFDLSKIVTAPYSPSGLK